MLNLTDDQLKKYFIGFSNYYMSKVMHLGKYKFIHDYQDPLFLKNIEKLVETEDKKNFRFKYNAVYEPFNTSLEKLLDNFSDERVSTFFKFVFNNCTIKRSEKLNVQESKAIITMNEDGKYDIEIEIPNITCVDAIAATIMHEFAHFAPVIYGKLTEGYEYSEVISMFFEYLMYTELLNEKGETTFLNNRLSMIEENFNNIKDNLHFALNPSYLKIEPQFYSTILASDLCYIDSFEYVLGLIERRKEDKKEVNTSVANILLGETTCIDEAKKLNIDTTNYPKIKKMIKK